MKQILLAFGSLFMVMLLFVSLRNLHVHKLSFEKSVEGINTNAYVGEAVIKITNNEFMPNFIDVKTGTKITFVNSTQYPVTIIIDNQNVSINSLGSYSKYFTNTGVFDYSFSTNPLQKVTIKVQ